MPRPPSRALAAPLVALVLAAALLMSACEQEPTTEAGTAAVPAAAPAPPVAPAAAPTVTPPATPSALQITYPQDGTLFPPDIVAPTFIWKDETAGVKRWQVATRGADGEHHIEGHVDEPRWRPSSERWKALKQESLGRDAEIVVAGLAAGDGTTPLSTGQVHIRTSTDPVGDSLFYREVPLPFLKAVRDPSKIRWRYGTIDMEDGPPIVLENLPVCGNCHSFADNGKVLGLDVDYGNDKGAYAVMDVSREMVMKDDSIITWADFKREDGELTFGLLSRVSPDGRYVVSTVKDRSVFVAMPDLMISQLFFPINGILVVYDRQTGKYASLPGADDPAYVQSNPVWSPDGKSIVFARAKAYRTERLDQANSALIDEKDVPEFTVDNKPFQYDLYRVPFNGGKGGTAEPLAGAANNGMSNYFPKYSPDGKWIVFCKAKNYMLLRPDSDLYIIPAAGGEARRLEHNTARMNSWHSWSSNSRWLVFSSKANGPYTQLFLTHIDEHGNDTPPVLLERFTSSDRAANIPEFVALPGDAIAKIREEFLDAYSFLRAGIANENTGDHEGAERALRRGLEIAPNDVDLRNALGWTLFQAGKPTEAVAEYRRALAAAPDHVKSHNNIALALVEIGQLDEAATHFSRSVELEPKPEIYSDLGFTLARLGKTKEAFAAYEKALALDSDCPSAHFNMAATFAQGGQFAEAEPHYRKALATRPAEAHNGLGYVLAQQGQTDEATREFEKAIVANPQFTPAYNNLAQLLEAQGKFEDAAAYYKRSLAVQPDPAVQNALDAVMRRIRVAG